MSVAQLILEKIEDFLPTVEAWASTTPSITDDLIVKTLKLALEAFAHRVKKQANGDGGK